MRYVLVFASLLILCFPSIASDEEVIENCKRWTQGKDDADKAKRVARCDQIIKDKHFSKADRAMAYEERARAARMKGRADDGIADLDQSLALEPDNVDRRKERGFQLFFKGQYDLAIADFDKVLVVKPGDDNVIFHRGQAYLEKGDETRGFAEMARAIELGNSPWLRHARAVAYAKHDQTDAALADIDASIALQDDYIFSYLVRAELYAKKGETEKAIADLTRAAELDPKYPIPISNRAFLYEQTKQFDKAIADYDALIALLPDAQYLKDRKAALLSKVPSTGPGPTTEAPSVTAPTSAAPLPQPPVAEAKAPQSTAGTGECRRFDAIANMTISVACPD